MKYFVTVVKTESYSAHIKIEAESRAQAESMAEDDAQHKALDWAYMEGEITAWAEPLDEPEPDAYQQCNERIPTPEIPDAT
jgi:hypothetical protein